MLDFRRRHHTGVWVLFFLLALRSVHTIPARQRLFSHLGDNGHNQVLVSAYALGWPLVSAVVSVLCCKLGWRFRDGHWRVTPRPSGLFAQAMVCVGLFWLEALIFHWLYPTVPVPGGFIGNVTYAFLVLVVAGFLATSLDGMDVAGQTHAQREADARLALTEARSSLVEASARLIAAQIDPHAIFNALNGVGSLIDDDPEQAKVMIGATSDYLKRLLQSSKSERIPLAQEKALIVEYLAVEGHRMGNRLSVEWDWPSEHDAVMVPPLLVQTLVENAIKHGIWPHRQGGTLRLSVSGERSKLTITVANTGAPLAAKVRGGAVGLENLRTRLGHAYGHGGAFTLATRGSWAVAEISIPLEHACAV